MNTELETPIKEILNTLQARKSFYQFLHLLFASPPTESMLKQMVENGSLADLKSMHEGGRLLYEYIETMTIERLEFETVEYQRLFIGPNALPAPPWESVYTSKEGNLFDDSTFEVREFYHSFGLRLQKENNEADDHLLPELEFMIFLIEKSQLDLNNAILNSQLDFLDSHLCRWIPQFGEKLIAHTDSKWFKGAAMLLTEFIHLDMETVQELKEALQNG